MNRFAAIIVLLASLALSATAAAGEISPQGKRLAETIDRLDVEHHWPAGVHVHWTTGIPDGRPESGTGKHTHCSAFVAAAAKRVGIYILRPPEHAQLLLANAQYDWLASGAGASEGWQPVANGQVAQDRANEGWLVVAAYRNHHSKKPGHIAIVRPSTKSAVQVLEEGPEVTQAGETNYRSTSLRQGFAGHPAAWSHHEVLYFVHPVDHSAFAAARAAGHRHAAGAHRPLEAEE